MTAKRIFHARQRTSVLLDQPWIERRCYDGADELILCLCIGFAFLEGGASAWSDRYSM